jgi:hypothetical protein
MFEQLEEPEESEENKPTDYTGLKIAAVCMPVFLLFVYLGNAEMGLVAFIVLGMTILAVGLRWNLRRHVWFWATVVIVLALHAYLLFFLRLPNGWLAEIGRLHSIGLLPIGVAELLITLGAIGLAEKLFSNGSSQDDEEE